MTPSYRIRNKDGLYDDGNADGHWTKQIGHRFSEPIYVWWGKNATWSKKGKIFFGRHRLKSYLNQFTNCGGSLTFALVDDWEIIEIGASDTTVLPPASFYHIWELLQNKIWETNNAT